MFGKDSNSWGPAYTGNMILSPKSPSYAQVKLTASFGDWFDFIYFHATLFSGLIDSLASNETGIGRARNKIFRQKYLAAHRIEISVIPGVDIGLTETQVYGDRGPELAYMIPIMFFKSAEHYLDDTGNTQWQFDIDINLLKRVGFYSALFIDEISLGVIFDSEKQRNWIGVQFGTFIVDPFEFLKNTDFRFEYTRLNPWVYAHRFETSTFKQHGFELGHWIGTNADLFRAEINHRLRRNLKLQGFYEYRRKGQSDVDVNTQYELPSESFLYPFGDDVTKNNLVGFGVRYEPVRDLFVKLQGQWGDKDFRGESLSLNEIFIGVSYNFTE